jgi:hypothetical protein
MRNQCKDCGAASICEHNRRRSSGKDCREASICEPTHFSSAGAGAPAAEEKAPEEVAATPAVVQPEVEKCLLRRVSPLRRKLGWARG